MAMIAPMKIVPQKSGIAPNAPDEPAWSARIAVCGLQFVPNRNSAGLTIEKKRIDSNRSEATIPAVVRIAISEARSSTPITSRSTRVRARKWGDTRVKAKAPPAKASSSATTAPISR